MTPALTPDLALAYLGELSVDVRAAVLLDAGGRVLAGDEDLADAARDLLAATDGSAIEVATGRGAVFAVRSPAHALVVVTGRFALPALVLYDLRAVLADLEPAAA
jgi:hypothetical protein